jgi:hypothetical protein
MVFLSDIDPSRRYLRIGFSQSASGSSDPTIATISSLSSGFGSNGSAEVHGRSLLSSGHHVI